MYGPGMGRPREFDRVEVRTRALDVFLQRGYHNTSVRELAQGMDINIATMYSTFGSKESLFLETLQAYEAENVPLYIGALEHPDADLDTIALVLRNFAAFADSGSAPGCLITNSAIELAPDAGRSQEHLLAYVERLSSAYANALRAVEAGPSTRRPNRLAHALAATTLGIFVLIRAKVPASLVHDVVDAAIDSLPERDGTIRSPRTPTKGH